MQSKFLKKILYNAVRNRRNMTNKALGILAGIGYPKTKSC